MRRFNVILVSAIICAILATASAAAQDSGGPTEQSVLEAARAKYLADQAQAAADQAAQAAEEAQRAAEAAAASAESEDEDYDEWDSEDEDFNPAGSADFSPFVLAFVPGLSFPFGTHDAAFSAGWIGIETRDVFGFQAASVFGLARNVDGFQGSGVFSIAEGKVNGYQGSGVFNIAEGGVDGVQTAGVFNITGGESTAPLQAAGVFNIADGMAGAQLAGVFNIAGAVDGVQIAGVFNIAERVDGLQLGVVNVADTVDGLQLGLVNIARNPGLSSQGAVYEPDTDFAYAAFQAGSRGLYTLFSVGKPADTWFDSADTLLLGVGLGTRINLGGLYVDVDASAVSDFGPDLPAIGEAMETGVPMADATGLIPYPSIRATVGIPILGRFHLVGGFKIDVDLDAAPRVPDSLRRGTDYASELFGIGYRAWIKPFFGLKL